MERLNAIMVGVITILIAIVLVILLGGLITAPLWNYSLAVIFPDYIPTIGIWRAGLLTGLFWFLFGVRFNTKDK